MNPRTFFEVAVGVLAIVAGLFWLQRHDANVNADWHRALDAAKAAVKAETPKQQAAVVHYDTVAAGWLGYKTKILHDTVDRPTKRERAIIAKCDTLKLAADTVIKHDTTLIRDLRNEVKIAEHPPRAPRLSYFGEALYDFVHRAPVARAGADLRVAGPLSISVAGQYDLPASGQQGGRPQALVGIRVRF